MNVNKKVLSISQAIEWKEKLVQENKTLVITNGCFDLLHRGHVQYLNDASSKGDELLVAINSDASLTALKGPLRPLVSQEDRAYILASMEAISAVVIFDGINCASLLKSIPPDVYVKGGDYDIDTINRDEYEVLSQTDCQFEFIPFVSGLSTTNLIDKIKSL